jgi:hypothetical protein
MQPWLTMNIYGADNKVLMSISSIEPDGNILMIKGKIFGTMPLSAKLRPEEARAALKLMSWKTRLFLLMLIFRRQKND